MFMLKQKMGQENFIWRSRPLSQSIGRGRINRVGPLIVRDRQERRDIIVTKILFWPKKQKHAILAWFFYFLSRIACCPRESRSAWQIFQLKQPKKKIKIFWPKFLYIAETKLQIQKPQFSMGTFDFLAAQTKFWGGGITSKPASQCPSWGIYKHAPPAFLAQKTSIILKKRGQTKSSS